MVADRWQTLQIVPDDTLCVTLYQLQPSTAYQFMIMSRNSHGDAMYSQPVATSTKGTTPLTDYWHGSVVCLSVCPSVTL